MRDYHLDSWDHPTLAYSDLANESRNGNPAVLGPKSGGLLVAWEQEYNGSNTRIMLSGVSSDGTIPRPHNPVEAAPHDDDLNHRAPILTELASGEVLLTWFGDDHVRRGNDESDESIYFGRLFHQNGVAKSAAFPLGQGDPSATPQHAAAALTDRGFLTSWRRDPHGDDDGDVIVRAFDALGTPRGPGIRIGDGVGDQLSPSLAELADGGVALVYLDRGDGGERIRLQVLDDSGNPTGPAMTVDTLPDGTGLGAPRVTVLASGKIAVTWTDERGDGGRALWGRLFEADGTPTGPTRTSEFALVPAARGMQTDHWVTPLPDGGGVVSWTAGRFTDGEIVIQRFADRGAAEGELRITDWGVADTGRALGTFASGELALAYGEGTDGFADYSHLRVGLYDYPRPSGERLTGTRESDTLTGGDGNDTIEGGGEYDMLFGGAGADHLDGGRGGAVLHGGGGRDTLVGNNFSDTLDGGPGRDEMVGGRGDDTYIVDHRADTLQEAPGGGTDTVLVEGSNFVFRLPAEIEVVRLKGEFLKVIGNDLDNLMSAEDDFVTLSGGAGDDTLVALADSARLNGGAGDDLILGGGGSDRLSGGAGADTLTGGDGFDMLIGGAGADILEGGRMRDDFVLLAAPGGGPDAADLILDFDPVAGEKLLVDDQILGFHREGFIHRGSRKNAELRERFAEEGKLLWDDPTASLLIDTDGHAGPVSPVPIAVLDDFEEAGAEMVFDALEFI